MTSADAWRLILPDRFDGPENMAIDEAVLMLVGDGVSPPTLRFYEWHSPWVSLGTAQSANDLASDALAERRWGVLRRASGGTAVLHQGQLGYALILPANHPLWEGDLASSYQRIANPFARGLSRLRVWTEPAPPSLKAEFVAGAPAVASRVCFSALGPYELLDRRGRKLIGNSQIRRRDSALQHGTVQISGSQCEIVDVLANLTPNDRANVVTYLCTHVGSVEESAGRHVGAPEIVEALSCAFEKAWGVHFTVGGLTDRERYAAEELVKTKYRDPNWTNRQ